MSLINTKIVLKKRPNPSVTEDLFEKIIDDIRDLVADEFLVEVIYLSIDPAMRGWISSVGNYSEPVPLNDPMRSFGVGKIISSKNNEFLENEFVVGWLGWQKYAIVTSKSIQMKIPSNEVPLSANLGVLGLNGITAYAGLVDKCGPKEDDTVIVTTAAGSVGSAVGQIAKIYGCKTIGLTSSNEKKLICINDFKYDEVINYKEVNDISFELKKIVPGGIDCFFDNVGGIQFDQIMENLNVGARVVICGTIGMPSYPIPSGPRINRTLLIKRAKIEGLLVLDYFDRYSKIYEKLSRWFKEGKLINKEDISEGLETAPQSLIRLLEGTNLGKQLVKV
ncbi:MAG: NADP-dependent oxidoreductase [Verrucomicrobia bacterium TMED56]|nr:MAG: NADP-dependent oxidoreductase [Verrucomicrobia bacterium TMED56]